MTSITVGEGKFQITLNVHSTQGYGLSCFLYGGELPHVGGVALAAPGVPVQGKMLSQCDIWTSTVPGHKDAAAAQVAARLLCMAARQPVSVCAGIHIDNATPEDIQILYNNCLTVTRHYIEMYVCR